ncbi:MAG: hypothetical protein H7832_00640 [Magnetococcus sp. DMHC-6]
MFRKNMRRFALLTISGQDRPGIVARVSQALFQAGCNIEDSSMTRLRGEFTILLVLQHDQEPGHPSLETFLEPTCRALELDWRLKNLPDVLPPTTSDPDHEFLIHILGADKPGIVYRVTDLLATASVNIVDLCTRIAGKPERPIYAMTIEVEIPGDPEQLQERLTQLAHQLGIEITLRASTVVTF